MIEKDWSCCDQCYACRPCNGDEKCMIEACHKGCLHEVPIIKLVEITEDGYQNRVNP